MVRVQPVILCGGSGTRLWPLSREQYPKQLLALAGGHTMLQATALRIDAGAIPTGWRLDQPLVVVNEDYRFITAEQLRQVAVSAAIMLVSVGRNTAPALTVAALSARGGNASAEDDPVLVVMPADHVIVQLESFRDAVAQALPLAAAGRLVTFGIVTTAPKRRRRQPAYRDVMTVGSAVRLTYARRLPARQRAPRAPRDG